MTNEEILALDRFECVSPKRKYVNVHVFVVMRCNFNDERLVEDLSFDFAENTGKPLAWFDPYLGRNPKSDIRIAFAYADGEALYFIEEKGGQRAVIRKDYLSTHYYTDDNDKSTILAAHIN